MKSLSPELSLLVGAIRWCVEDGSLSRIGDEIDWNQLFKLSRHHNVLPWLWSYIDAASTYTRTFRRDLAEALRSEEIKTQLQKKELIELSSALCEKDVPHMVFKGVSIEKLFYCGLVRSRYADDIDILISASDLKAATDIILSNGYRVRVDYEVDKLASFLMRHKNLYRWRDIGFLKRRSSKEKIDLHWRIADSFTLPIDTEKLLESPETIVIDGHTVPCMAFNQLFVYTCVHGYTDYFFRLRHLVDIYCAMHQPEFDLDSIRKVAKEWGVLRQVESSIATCKWFFSDVQESDDPYVAEVVRRYSESEGFPKRSHPNKGQWTAKDKWQHLNNQIKFRSRNSPWYAPLVARCKYNADMVQGLPNGVSPLLWYPVAALKRLLQ